MSNDNKALAIVPQTVDGFADLAMRFSKSALLPDGLKGKEPDILVTLLAGQEMGLPPMASLRGIHVINGKPVLAADTMVAVVLGSGKAIYFTRVDDGRADAVTYETQRQGHPKPTRVTWSMEDAKRAGLADGNNWKKYPRAMLAARAKAELARDVYPDVLAGCYDPDEAREFSGDPAPYTPRDVVDADVVTSAPAPDVDYAARIAACETLADLQAMAGDLSKAPRSQHDALRVAYRTRRDALTPAPEVAA